MNDLFIGFTSPDLDVRHETEIRLSEMARNDSTLIDNILIELRRGNSDLRWYLSRTLIKVGDSIIPRIVEESKVESDFQVLKYFGAILAEFGKKSVPILIGLFSSKNESLRGMAGAALLKIGDEAIDDLKIAMKSDDETTRLCATLVLMKMGVF